MTDRCAGSGVPGVPPRRGDGGARAPVHPDAGQALSVGAPHRGGTPCRWSAVVRGVPA